MMERIVLILLGLVLFASLIAAHPGHDSGHFVGKPEHREKPAVKHVVKKPKPTPPEKFSEPTPQEKPQQAMPKEVEKILEPPRPKRGPPVGKMIVQKQAPLTADRPEPKKGMSNTLHKMLADENEIPKPAVEDEMYIKRMEILYDELVEEGGEVTVAEEEVPETDLGSCENDQDNLQQSKMLADIELFVWRYERVGLDMDDMVGKDKKDTSYWSKSRPITNLFKQLKSGNCKILSLTKHLRLYLKKDSSYKEALRDFLLFRPNNIRRLSGQHGFTGIVTKGGKLRVTVRSNSKLGFPSIDIQQAKPEAGYMEVVRRILYVKHTPEHNEE